MSKKGVSKKRCLKTIFLILSLILIFMVVFFAGKGDNKKSKNIELLGAGATFPYPLYSKMFDEYYKIYGIKVNYQAIGSGGGIRQLLSKTVDFGGTDAYMTDEKINEANGQILHIPTCLGAIVVIYNLPGSPKLRLTGEIVADIFLGKIKKWNDEKIRNLNSNIDLPDLDIIVAHRSDGSGTTFNFSNYLSKVSLEWKEKVGFGKSLNWPVGVGGKGNPGVAGIVKQTEGAIGYVEIAYAIQNNLAYAKIKNKKGYFIEPTLESVSAAANIDIPEDTRIIITDTDSEEGYPISTFTWIIFYKEQNYNGRSLNQARELLTLLWWMIHEGQKYNETLYYGKLPLSAVKKAEKILESVTYNGKKIKFK